MRLMQPLGPAPWPPPPITTDRLTLRVSEARDREGLIELFASPEVGTFIGGERPREELEASVPEIPGRREGFFVVERDGEFLGMVTFDRRDAEHPGHVRPEGNEAQLGYLFLPDTWGKGYATEACTAALAWFATAFPGEPVVLPTQTANAASVRLAERLGFRLVERFEEYDAEQWFGAWAGPGAGSSPA